MSTVDDVARAVARLAPPELAEAWDNTGLLLGDRAARVDRAMTCLTITPDSAGEAIDQRAGLIVTHHPLPFRPVQQITTDTRDGALLWRLARAGVAVYSPHTRFDSAASGVNRQLAERLGLADVAPLEPTEGDPTVGAGRSGLAAEGETVATVARRLGEELGLASLRVVGRDEQPVRRVGLACGSGGSLLDPAIAAGCDALVTGEATFHTCLAAESAGVALLLTGHYASERFAVEWLAGWLGENVPGVEFWASRREKDPLRVVS